MTINKNSTEQINVALLDLENKIKRNNQTAAISALENDITLINKTLKEKQNGLVPGETYNINISGNAATSNHALTSDNATTADSANTATSAGHANTANTADSATNADNATHADNADYATTAGTAAIAFPEGFVYKQYYNPSTSSWEKTPAQMGLQVPSGYKWTEITSDFSSYPYSKIGTTVTGNGHNARHRHGMNHKHRMEHTHLMNHDHYFADWFGSGATTASSSGICMIAASNNRGSTTRSTWRSGDYYTSSGAHTGTYYTGNSITTGSASGTDTGRGNTDYDTSDTTYTYPEPNYHGCKLWKVVVDA